MGLRIPSLLRFLLRTYGPGVAIPAYVSGLAMTSFVESTRCKFIQKRVGIKYGVGLN